MCAEPKEHRDPRELLPDELARQIPALYATESQSDPTAYVKLVRLDGLSTWFVTEFDPEHRLCFGLICGGQRRFGYFTLDDLEQKPGRLRPVVERDVEFVPAPLSKCL